MRVLSGDWKAGPADLRKGFFGQPKSVVMQKPGRFFFEHVKLKELNVAEVISADDKASITGKAVAGAAGMLLLGPVGLLAGALGAGNKRLRTVVLIFKDGRKALVECKPEEATALVAAAFH